MLHHPAARVPRRRPSHGGPASSAHREALTRPVFSSVASRAARRIVAAGTVHFRSPLMAKKASPSIPRHVTPPAERIRPPSRHREDILPLVDIGSVKFEELCRDILPLAFPDVVRQSLKRKSGSQQFGVDVEGFDARHVPFVVVSCKCYEEVKGRYLLPWTMDFSTHLDGHWKDKGVNR